MKKKRGERVKPSTRKRVMQAWRSTLSQTVSANQRKATKLKVEIARAMVCSNRAGSSRSCSDISFFFVEGHALTPAILHQGSAILVPDDHAIERKDERCPRTRDLVVDGSFA